MTRELETGCITSSQISSDSLLISVMSRHTLNDGKTPDLRIVKGINYDIWCPQFAPPLKLIGDYYKRNLPWRIFEDRYIDFLQNKFQRNETLNLIYIASKIKVKVLCIEETPEFCHRRLLAEECQRIEPNLILTLH